MLNGGTKVKITRFEDLECWQEARVLTRNAFDQTYISKDEFQNTYDHCAKVRKIIDGLIRYLKNH